MQVRQLHRQNRSLQRVQPGVPAHDAVLVFGGASMLPQNTKTFHQIRIAGGNRSPVSIRSQVLPRIEAIACETAGSADCIAVDRSTVRLRTIFNDDQIVPRCQLLKRLQVHRSAIQMHRNNCSCATRDRLCS